MTGAPAVKWSCTCPSGCPSCLRAPPPPALGPIITEQHSDLEFTSIDTAVRGETVNWKTQTSSWLGSYIFFKFRHLWEEIYLFLMTLVIEGINHLSKLSSWAHWKFYQWDFRVMPQCSVPHKGNDTGSRLALPVSVFNMQYPAWAASATQVLWPWTSCLIFMGLRFVSDRSSQSLNYVKINT